MASSGISVERGVGMDGKGESTGVASGVGD